MNRIIFEGKYFSLKWDNTLGHFRTYPLKIVNDAPNLIFLFLTVIIIQTPENAESRSFGFQEKNNNDIWNRTISLWYELQYYTDINFISLFHSHWVTHTHTHKHLSKIYQVPQHLDNTGRNRMIKIKTKTSEQEYMEIQKYIAKVFSPKQYIEVNHWKMYHRSVTDWE